MPVPIPTGTKAPRLPGWQKLRLTDGEAAAHFGGGGNIGLLLGEPSGWLVDVDLDCTEARELAGEFLPRTPVVTGRPGAPASHRWYIARGAKTRRYQDPVTDAAIVELRSTGAQTLVGPSVHPSGEAYDPLDGEPAVVGAEQLATCVEALAEAVVLRRHGRVPAKAPAVLAQPTSTPRAGNDIERRAAAYLDAMPPAVSGQGGHNQTYAAATAMVHGFGLDRERAFALLWERYNPRCQPPWSERELRHKVEDAATKPHSRPPGWLRDSGHHAEANDVDLSGFMVSAGKAAAEEDEEEAAAERPGDPGPFPQHLLRVPGFIEQVMAHNLATATRPQPVLALAAAICLQAVLAARKVRDERGNRTNVYCVGLAPSGAGKDHARKVNKNILFSADLVELEGNEDLASDAGLVTAVEHQPATLFQIDEFGRFLRTIGDPKKAPHLFNVLTALMKLYSSADTTFRGKAYADKERNKVVDQPCVSVYGTTVPEHFFESLTAESLSDGFLARLLVFEAQATTARQRAPAQPIPGHIKQTAEWWGAYKPGGNLGSEHPNPRIIEATAPAIAIFDQLAERVDAELAQAERRGIGGASLWARAEEKACRLALIYACSKNHESPVIDEDAAHWACELSSYLTRRMLFVAGEWVADGLFDAKQKRVLRVIRQCGSVTRTDLNFKTRWLSLRDRQEVLDNLIETGQVRVIETPTAGRTRVEYAIT